jgi:UDP-N-acetylmuramate--alanine ligase
VSDRKVVTYGFSPQADVRAVNVKRGKNGTCMDVVINDRKAVSTRTLQAVDLPMFGDHNIQNALAAIAIASEMGIEDNILQGGLANFEGVKRRFTKTGEVDGVTVIDDYGHHPVEIMAVLAAARDASEGQVIAVMQPHRHTRLRDLFEDFCTCFNDADAVLVTDVFAAGEAPINGFDRDALVRGLRERGHRTVMPLLDVEHLPSIINDLSGPGDMVVCLGAGNITQLANALPEKLRMLRYGTDGADE